jgi:hypothetical protein
LPVSRIHSSAIDPAVFPWFPLAMQILISTRAAFSRLVSVPTLPSQCSPVAELSGGRGNWDSIHVVEVSPSKDGKTAGYKLTSSVLLSLQRGADGKDTDGIGKADLSGSLTRQASQSQSVTPEKNHIVNIGTMIEAMEADMRGSLDALYIAKSKEIVAACHTCTQTGPGTGSKGFVADLSAAVKKHGGQ